ncbi:MAG TPA: chemotaxis protein CheA [Candidatus Angelobacter sp.]|nr:chemotaxis protein CheA [Candidatus Angelobacter sp.]
MDELDQLRQTYFQDCDELLGELESALMALDNGRADGDTLNDAFRAIHSIKGGADILHFDRLVRFAHTFESMLDRLRLGKLAVDPELASLMLRAGDAIADLVRAAQAGSEMPDGYENEIADALQSLALAAGAAAETAAANGEESAALNERDPAATVPTADAPLRHYRILLSPPADLFLQGNEPQLLIRALERLGSVKTVADASALPPLASFDAEQCYLRWTVDVRTTAGPEAIRDVFDLAVDKSDLEITELTAPPADAAVAGTSDAVPAPTPATAPSGPSPIKPASGTVPGVQAKAAPTVNSIRVDLEKLDYLVNLVGELVISQSMLAEQLSVLPTDKFPTLSRSIEEMSQHARNLQDGVMAVRTQPVKSVFARMPRLVRDLAVETGKNVRLLVSGETTEVDKTVVEQLFDPLLHMIRNAVDHGIESPAERGANGKPAQGTVRLSAAHVGGRIVIQVTDDGRGIDRARVRARAVERGLLDADSVLTEEQLDNLIFLPGLSTAETVSDISGRGVGMDVVRRNVERLGGRVLIRSVAGKGSTFYLSLPLTLAVLDGMIIGVGRETYVVPLTVILESLRPQARDVHRLVGGGEVLYVRGEYVPLVYLGRAFDVPDATKEPWEGLVMLVDADAGGKIGVVVDEIVGQQQVVIKSVESNYRALRGIAGATILGNGRVALILDVAGLAEAVGGAGQSPASAAA